MKTILAILCVFLCATAMAEFKQNRFTTNTTAEVDTFIDNTIRTSTVARASAAAYADGALPFFKHLPLIWKDDDWAGDIDDMFDLTYTFALVDDGLIQVVGCGSANSLDTDWTSPALADAFCNYYGHPEVVQGQALPTWLQGGLTTVQYIYGQPILGLYQHAIPNGTNAMSATQALRRILSECPTNSLRMTFGGGLRNLYNLYHSAGDAISPLTGAQLIARGCDPWLGIITVDSLFPTRMVGDEIVNLNVDPLAAWVLTNNFGVMVNHIGLELGNAVVTGNGITNRNSDDIMQMATKIGGYAYGGYGFTRQNWTEFATSLAAFGTNWFGASTPSVGFVYGTIAMGTDAGNITNSWTTNAAGMQRYITMLQPAEFYATNFNAYYSRSAKFRPATTTLNGAVAVGADGASSLNFKNGLATGIGALSIASFSAAATYDALYSTNTANNSTVSLIPDSSGNNYTMNLVAGHVSGVTYVTNVLNGKPAYHFAGATSSFSTPNLFANSQPFSIWGVFYCENATNQNFLFGGLPGNMGVRVYQGKLDLIQDTTALIGSSSAGSIQSSNWYAFGLTYDTAHACTFWINGQKDVTATNSVTFSGGSTGTFLGDEYGNNQFGGYIAHLSKSPLVLNDAGMLSLMTVLNSVYSIYIPQSAPAVDISLADLSLPLRRSNTVVSLWNPLVMAPSFYVNSQFRAGRFLSIPDISGHNRPMVDLVDQGATNDEAVVNGLSAMRFDAGNTNRFAASYLYANQVPATFWAVVYPTNVSMTNAIFGSVGQNLNFRILNGKLDLVAILVGDIGQSTSSLTVSNWAVVVGTYRADGEYRLYINGTLDKIGTNLVTLTGGNTGTYFASEAGADQFGGWILEAGKLDYIISTNDVSHLQAYYNALAALGSRVYSMEGKVGILTNDPQSALHVVGDVTEGNVYLTPTAAPGQNIISQSTTDTNSHAYFGYNFLGEDWSLPANDQGVVWAVEGNYDDGLGHSTMEAYQQWQFAPYFPSVAGSNTYRRSFFSSFDKGAKNIMSTSVVGGTNYGLSLNINDGTGTTDEQIIGKQKLLIQSGSIVTYVPVYLNSVLQLAPLADISTSPSAATIWNSNNAAIYIRGTNGVDNLLTPL